MDIYPNYEFWESDLEVPARFLLERFQDQQMRLSWLNSLSGRQLDIIFKKHFQHKTNQQLFNNLDHDTISTQQKRKLLGSYSHSLFNYYLLSYFDRTRLELVVSEIARSSLTQELIAPYLTKNNSKYDKKSLLFLLFNTDHDLLKSVYHFDKIQKKVFVPFALQNPTRQPAIPFKNFISHETIQLILKDKKSENYLRGFFYNQNRIYILMRQASHMDLLLSSSQIVHGHKPEWVILDFLLTGTQVEISAKNITQAVAIANSIASCYFNRECSFVSVQDLNFPEQVQKFLRTSIEGSDPDIRVFELTFKSSRFKSDNTSLTLTVAPYDSILSELHTIETNVGDILHSIQSVKMMFKDKKVTLLFAPSGKIHYLERSLNKKEREDLKVHMKTLYGLTILPKTNC